MISSQTDLPKLEHGLDDVLFHRGIHPLKDFESNKFNYPEYLEKIHQPMQINTLAIPKFIPTSLDQVKKKKILKKKKKLF